MTAAELDNLPQNPLGQWIAAKQPSISTLPVAADQVAILALTVSGFAA